jgi:hypothetical protein
VLAEESLQGVLFPAFSGPDSIQPKISGAFQNIKNDLESIRIRVGEHFHFGMSNENKLLN